MLILTARPGEKIFITHGDVEIEFVLISTKGNQSRIGFDAPDEVRIVREKVRERNKVGHEQVQALHIA